MVFEICILVALVLVNGLFAGAEMAVVSVRASRVAELVATGRTAALALERLRAKPERFLATVQVGITVVSAAAGAFGGAALSEDFAPLVASVPLLAPYAEELALGIVVAGLAYLSLILGELVPKSLALRSSESFALLVARPLLGLAWLATPLVWFLTASSNIVLRAFGDRTNFLESRVSVDELLHLVGEAQSGGEISHHTGEIAARALEFEELAISEVMVHRRNVVGLDVDSEVSALRSALLDVGHSRVPVFEGTIDNVTGYVHVRDVLEAVWSNAPLDLRSLARPGWFVPETKPAADVLREMQSKALHLAFVVDEHGGTAGIVTLEDLLEEIVGEIFSEDDPGHLWQKVHADGGFVVPGNVSLRDVDRALGTELADERADTLGGLCTVLAGGHLPKSGEKYTAGDGTALEVLEASVRRVRTVRVRPPPPPPPES